MIVVRGASVFTRGGWRVTDVGLDEGRIAVIGDIPAGDHETIDGAGSHLGPGFVDLHTHVRDPGQTWKEDMASATAAAVRGGYTAILAMPNSQPPIDSADVVERVLRTASESSLVEVGVAGALTMGRSGEDMAHLDDMYRLGVRVFTDDGDVLADAGLLSRVLTYLSDRVDAVVAQHAEDRSLSRGGHMNHGTVSERLGILGSPGSAESSIIARDLEILAETGGRYHVQHLSTARSVELVRSAKAAGLDVTAEVTPHHLTFTEDDCATLDTSYKMYPPLRSKDDREALLTALADGTIDLVATDHAPHTESEKDVPFEEAPRGVIGLETAFPATLAALDGDLRAVFERMSVAPARVGGFARQGRPVDVGEPANLVLVDPTLRWVPERFASKSSNSPFSGRELVGRVLATIVDGEVRHGDVR